MIKKLFSNILGYGGINAFKSLVPFLMLPILTNYITPKDYGKLSLIETTVLFLFPLVSINIHGAINVEYFKINSKKEFKLYVVNALFLATISFLILFIIFNVLSEKISNIIHLAPIWIKLVSLFAFLRVFSSVILIIFQASQNIKKYALFSLSQTIIDFSLSYYLVVVLKEGFIGRLIGVYGTFFIFTLISIIILYYEKYFKIKFVLKYIKSILDFGIPLILHSISGIILAMSDRYFISYFNGNEYVGLYTTSYQVAALLLLISLSVNQAWSPVFMNLMNKKEFKKIKRIIKIFFILFIFSAIIVYFLKDLIYAYFIGHNFQSSKKYVLPLLIGFLFQSLYFLFTNFLFFYKKTKVLALITFIGAILNLILNYIFIKKYSVIGVAYATAITYFFYFLLVFSFSYFYNKVQYEYIR